MAEKPARPRLARAMSRRSMLAGAAAAGVTVPVVAAGLGSAAAAPETARPARAGVTRRITVYAEEIGGGLFGYGLSPGTATVPGPILEIWEGDTLEIDLVNNTDRRLSIHPHGVDYDVDSDGSPLNASFNEPGQRRKYIWKTRAPYQKDGRWMPGSAGYWHYHDHAMGGDHGTDGLRAGLYGALIVRREGDLLPKRQYTVVFNGMTINNRVAPDIPVIEANLGERVEFIAIGHGDFFHTFHLHAHRWADNRTGMLSGPDDPTQVIDNRDLNPGDSFGFQVIAGEGVGPGVWMYHCHVQFHSDGGMAGVWLIRNADGSMPEGAQETLDRYHQHHHVTREPQQLEQQQPGTTHEGH
ncbi:MULTISPECIES: multicopper oxidase domain-containing protein [Prauserella]|nr:MULTISPECIES: multicopper oxidase domain-containing protein [Prauserella]